MDCNCGDLHSSEHSHGQHLTLHTTGTSTTFSKLHLWNLQYQHEEDIDHLATNCNCGITRVRRTVWTMGNGLCAMTGKYHVTVLLVHTGHDVEHLGPGNNRKEHSTRSIITSKTKLAHATDRNDDERGHITGNSVASIDVQSHVHQEKKGAEQNVLFHYVRLENEARTEQTDVEETVAVENLVLLVVLVLLLFFLLFL